jgi:hypothetical protein
VKRVSAPAEASHAVVKEAMDAGVWVFAGGLHPIEEVSVVATDGAVTDGPESKAYIGGLTIIDVPSREEALEWAAKIAVACRCAQEVREFLPDPAIVRFSDEFGRDASSKSVAGRLSPTNLEVEG